VYHQQLTSRVAVVEWVRGSRLLVVDIGEHAKPYTDSVGDPSTFKSVGESRTATPVKERVIGNEKLGESLCSFILTADRLGGVLLELISRLYSERLAVARLPSE
jgi:hypothetical protein